MNWKRLLKWLGATIVVVLTVILGVAGIQLLRFHRAAHFVYDIDPLPLFATSDSAVIQRGRHLAESLGNCLGCHGPDLGGALVDDIGPIGRVSAPNLTTGRGGVGSQYTDGELARAVRHGIGSDGRTLFYMPTPEHNWWPDSDVVAVVSFVRSMPPVDGAREPSTVLPFGRILDQFGVMQLRSAETVDHNVRPTELPDPEPTARYGAFLARGCVLCHGEEMSGGRIPGAPSTIPIPTNLTPHETGLAGWTEGQFFQLIDTGRRPDGTALDPFMPIGVLRAMNDIERRALWAHLRSLEPREFGSR